MKNPLIKLAGLALAGVLVAPAMAQADPSVTATASGAPAGDVAYMGQPVHVVASDCINPADGTPGYTGEFVSMVGDPATNEPWQFGDTQADDTGEMTYDVVIPTGDPATFYVRWYCASQPMTAIDSQQMLWVDSLMTIDIQPADAMSGRSATLKVAGGGKAVTATVAKRHTGSTVIRFPGHGNGNGNGNGRPSGPTTTTVPATTPAAPALTINVDPNSLPLVDRIDIPGAQAAKLKVRVDTEANRRAQSDRSRVKGGRSARAAGRGPAVVRTPTNTEYVAAAFDVLTQRSPNNKTVKSFVADLDAGQTRVQVVEAIALTAHAAPWWIRNT